MIRERVARADDGLEKSDARRRMPDARPERKIKKKDGGWNPDDGRLKCVEFVLNI
jgi:hypothetical protein